MTELVRKEPANPVWQLDAAWFQVRLATLLAREETPRERFR